MNQFEIWWADLPKPVGRRPVLLLSRGSAYLYLHKFIVAEVTTTIRDIPVEVSLGRREGLRTACVVNCDNLRTVPKHVLTERISQLSARRSLEVKRALGYALGWDELMDAGQ